MLGFTLVGMKQCNLLQILYRLATDSKVTQLREDKMMHLVLSWGRGRPGGAKRREKGSESVRAVQKKRARSGIPRLVGSERKRKKYTTLCNILQSRKGIEVHGGSQQKGVGTWNWDKVTGSTKIGPPCPPPHLYIEPGLDE